MCFRVIDGWETLDELEKLPVKEKSYRPLTDIKLQSVTIHANPIANGNARE
jgi:peptidyl-prolyl cis-trans isomerase-like 3